MLNKITRITFEVTEIFHKTFKHHIILERGRIVRGTRQLLQKGGQLHLDENPLKIGRICKEHWT